MININFHDVAKIVISKNSRGNSSYSRDVVFLDHDGNEIVNIDIFSSDVNKKIEIIEIDDDSYVNWNFEQIKKEFDIA